MRIYFAGDHAGFEMKRRLVDFVRSLGHEVEDMGPFSYDKEDDYPDYVIPLARKVASYSPLLKGALPSSAGGMLTSSGLEDSATSLIREDTTPAPHFSEKVGGTPSNNPPRQPPLVRGIKGDEVKGIVVAGSGQGEIIAMNRVKGARAALLAPGPQMLPLIKASRDHNDSTILAIGARFCTLEEAKQAITLWLEMPFSNDERHVRRLQKIEQMV